MHTACYASATHFLVLLSSFDCLFHHHCRTLAYSGQESAFMSFQQQQQQLQQQEQQSPQSSSSQFQLDPYNSSTTLQTYQTPQSAYDGQLIQNASVGSMGLYGASPMNEANNTNSAHVQSCVVPIAKLLAKVSVGQPNGGVSVMITTDDIPTSDKVKDDNTIMLPSPSSSSSSSSSLSESGACATQQVVRLTSICACYGSGLCAVGSEDGVLRVYSFRQPNHPVLMFRTKLFHEAITAVRILSVLCLFVLRS